MFVRIVVCLIPSTVASFVRESLNSTTGIEPHRHPGMVIIDTVYVREFVRVAALGDSRSTVPRFVHWRFDGANRHMHAMRTRISQRGGRTVKTRAGQGWARAVPAAPVRGYRDRRSSGELSLWRRDRQSRSPQTAAAGMDILSWPPEGPLPRTCHRTVRYCRRRCLRVIRACLQTVAGRARRGEASRQLAAPFRDGT